MLSIRRQRFLSSRPALYKCSLQEKRIWQILKWCWIEGDIDFQALLKRPLSLTAAVLASLLIVYEVIQIANGNLYEKALGGIDGTTLVELGILTLLGVYALRDQTDLQAMSFTLVAGLSFVFLYEAIYKWSFYRAPFDQNRPMPASELREFVIQAGIAATALTGFAEGVFTFKKWTYIWLGFFVILWIFWLLVGYPQLTGEVFFPKVIRIDLTHDMTYLLSRSTKAMIFFAYLTIFPPLRRKRAG